ncbi:MAG TPA: hypothetical protein VGF43_10945 [Dongiaceae bacterium]|jgi:hypothetical protein
MSKIKLDPAKLLGFKIVATGQSTVTLRSPKIGGKGCPGVDMAAGTTAAALCAKVGTKTD